MLKFNRKLYPAKPAHILVLLFSLALFSVGIAQISSAQEEYPTKLIVTQDSTEWLYSEFKPSGSYELVDSNNKSEKSSLLLKVDEHGEVLYSNFDLKGWKFSNFKAIDYKTFVESEGNYATELWLNVNYEGESEINNWQGNVVYEPSLNGSIQKGKWQTWKTIEGKWWATDKPGSDRCPRTNPCLWTHFMKFFPNISIQKNAGALLFVAGNSEVEAFDGFVDDLQVKGLGHNVLYDFEKKMPEGWINPENPLILKEKNDQNTADMSSEMLATTMDLSKKSLYKGVLVPDYNQPQGLVREQRLPQNSYKPLTTQKPFLNEGTQNYSVPITQFNRPTNVNDDSEDEKVEYKSKKENIKPVSTPQEKTQNETKKKETRSTPTTTQVNVHKREKAENKNHKNDNDDVQERGAKHSNKKEQKQGY